MKRSPYAGFDPLRESGHWEDRTREVVLRRLQQVPKIRFFTAEEVRLLDAVADRVMPQEDREPHARVPITPFIDEALFVDDTDGFRKADMPWEQQAWKGGLAGIEETSQARFGAGFTSLAGEPQDEVLAAVQRGEAEGPTWLRLPAAEFFGKLTQQVISVYYAHPTAWAEIGWPGPASKRGYMRIGYGRIDPWQPRESEQVSSVQFVQRHHDGGGPRGPGGATH